MVIAPFSGSFRPLGLLVALTQLSFVPRCQLRESESPHVR